MNAKLLGELLVNKGVIASWQLEAVLQEQRTSGELLGTILVRKGWVTEDALLKTLADQMEIPYVSLETEPVDWTVAKGFPSTLFKEHDCFPIRMTELVVTVAIANPLDVWAASEVEKVAHARGLRVQLVLASTRAIHAAIQRFHQETMKSLNPS